MTKQKIIRRNFTDTLASEYPESVFLQYDELYNDAIIGVTENGRIVYDYFQMEHLFYVEYLSCIYNYEDDFSMTEEQNNHISKTVLNVTQNSLAYYETRSPVFCKDKHFISEILPTLHENEWSRFQDEK